ncbi:hypothetical protein [Allomesorhizobium camelthorni]|uniref:Uncharacterized protein n=1 Tax=Allomesorhizobium camelthorni TaxID=475069 RepID=A0A6G4WEV4_9HYPH|nr:hypothetical protein [Mesorhizobium camelthorni]NGO53139.1 hypothetical protein [Mesorhizobium camelthorni]
MPLQNRVDPFGEIHAVPARGMFTGNRGVIHDPATRTLLQRRWSTKAWIICVCEFRGHRREVMGRNAPSGNAGWTELFFLDEVTALAAGHRPCFYCRRERAKAFAGHYGDAFRIAAPKAGEIDARLHGERLASGGHAHPVDAKALRALPDGTVVASGGQAFAMAGAAALPWSFSGYGPTIDREALERRKLLLVTPPATVAILRSGYRPAWANKSGR